MDKEYLIHNIDYKDNPEDQHLTVDITLSNLDVSGQDIIADVGIDTYVNGISTRSSIYEDVSLTGAGGMPSANVTIIPKLNNADVQGTINSLNLQIVETQIGDYYLDGGSIGYGNEQAVMPIKVPPASKLQQIALSTNNGVYIWFETAPINIEGAATFDGGVIIITGDCTITVPVVED